MVLLAAPAARRPAPAAARAVGPASWRWLRIAIVAWLSLILAGREHVLSAIGLEIACIHPGEVAGAHASDRDDHRAGSELRHDAAEHVSASPAPADLPDDPSASDAEGADDCPVGCTGCTCGAAHFSLPTTFLVATRTWSQARLHEATGRDGPWRALSGLDRPPRRAS